MIIKHNDEELVNGQTLFFEGGYMADEQIQTLTIENDDTEEDLTIHLTLEGSGFRLIGPTNVVIDSEDSTDVSFELVFDVPGTFTRKLFINDFLIILHLEVPQEGLPVYTNRTNVERTFGKRNVQIWADLDGDADENAIELTVYQHCQDVSRIIDALLNRGYYSTPFDLDPVPSFIEMMARKKVGCQLYYSRAIYSEGFDRMMGYQAKEFSKTLDLLNQGKIILEDALRNTTQASPFVQNPTIPRQRGCYNEGKSCDPFRV